MVRGKRLDGILLRRQWLENLLQMCCLNDLTNKGREGAEFQIAVGSTQDSAQADQRAEAAGVNEIHPFKLKNHVFRGERVLLDLGLKCASFLAGDEPPLTDNYRDVSRFVMVKS